MELSMKYEAIFSGVLYNFFFFSLGSGERPRKRIGGAIPEQYRDTGPRLEFALNIPFFTKGGL
jgi:hypothetical protein